MTHSTDAERGIASLRHLYQQMIEGGVKDSAQAKRLAEGLLSPAIAKLEQAARRAPAAQVPQGWKLVPIQDNCTMWTAGGEAIKACGGHERDAASLAYRAMIAAAPQPPEVGHE